MSDQPAASTVTLAEGQEAPEFTLPDQNGEQVTLSELRGHPVVLYFYPKDNTPGCTTEACNFRDDYSQYERLGAKVLGVSPDSVQSHRKFVDKKELPFTLLADTDFEVCRAYGAWKPKTIFGKTALGIHRSTVLIDASGKIAKLWPKVKVATHSAEVLEAIEELSK